MGTIRSRGMFIFSLIGVVVFLCSLEASAEILNRVVAVVNDDVITLHELNQRIKRMTGLNAQDLKARDENSYLEARRKILELMIDERCAEDKIRELGIKIFPRQIDAAVEKIKRDNRWTHEDLLARLKREGITFEKYRENIKKDLERIRLINTEVKSKIIIREEQISRYYENHRGDFSVEEAVHLAGIFLMRRNPKDQGESLQLYRKGEAILSRLKNGEDFGDLARKFSQGPGARDGGDLGTFKTVQLEPELKKIVELMPEGAFSDLIIRPNGIQIVKLTSRQKAEMKPLEEVRDAIYAILYKNEVNRRYASWIRELRKESYTKIIF